MWVLPSGILFYTYLWVKSSFANSLNSFDDSIIFKFSWNDIVNENELLNIPKNDNILLLTTQEKDKYLCYLPNEIKTDRSTINEYKGPTGLELLNPLFFQSKCSYKQDQYWTYELCHGRHLRQFHEESTFQGSKVQEFYLGRYDPSSLETKVETGDPNLVIPTVKVGDSDLPFLEINMTLGTVCDLNKKPRSIKVKYVCNDVVRHDFYSLKETSTCEYEAIFLTPFLCLHPHFAGLVTPQNDIQCHAIEGSPVKPREIGREEPEYPDDYAERFEEPNIAEFPNEIITPPPPPPHPPVRGESEMEKPPHDPKLIEDFLSGAYCLQGGSGWWKYEFCFGKKVEQFHEVHNKRQSILLGVWNKKEHLTWIQRNSHRKPKTGTAIKQVIHYYGGGSICEVTQKRRSVEVKLKCKESSKRMDAVSLYLHEPKTCEYVLTVESAFICPLLESVNEDGTFNSKLF